MQKTPWDMNGNQNSHYAATLRPTELEPIQQGTCWTFLKKAAGGTLLHAWLWVLILSSNKKCSEEYEDEEYMM